MPITNQQYDSLMRIYKQKQFASMEENLNRTKFIHENIEGFKALDDSIADFALEKTRKLLSGDKVSSDEISNRIDELIEQKKALLVKSGYPSDYLEPQYECPDCKDTGFIDGEKCHCFKKLISGILEGQSNLGLILENNNFSKLSTEYYQGEDLVNFQRTVSHCHEFIENFNSNYENLLFYGTVGTGKSFLSGCIAGELLKLNHSVVYYSATQLFKLLSDIMFNKGERSILESIRDNLYASDLLIIDDLGTEIMNSAVATELFSLLNERNIYHKSTIISTNLGFKELQERYADRIFSRLLEQYSFYRLSGPDIRRIK